MAKIKIDSSDILVVLVCESCAGTWRACAWSRSEAHDRAVEHEQRAHPGEKGASAARTKWRQRRQAERPPALATRR